MRLVPEDKYGKVGFYSSRLDDWLAHAAEIGLDAETLVLLQADVEAAQAKLTAHYAAQVAARSATIAMNEAIDQMCKRGAAAIEKIRGTAGLNGSGVYQLAKLSPPKTPAVMGPPGDPTDFKTAINQVGWLTLRWKCKNPRGSCGTMYQVRRQLDGEGPFEPLATVGKKVYIDGDVPLGTKSAMYEVQAIRSTRSGMAKLHSVHFGSVISAKQANALYRPRDAA